MRENSPTTLEPPPEKDQTSKTEGVTLKNGAELSNFPWEAKVFGIHLVKKKNRNIPDASEGGCKLYGRRSHPANLPQEGSH